MKKNQKYLTRYLIYSGFYLAVLILIIVLGILPQYNNLAKNQKDLSGVKSELNVATKKRSGLEKLSKDKTKIDQIKLTALEYLPETKNNSDFVVKVEALAKELSVTVKAFSFTEVKAQTKVLSDTSDTVTDSKTSAKSSSSDSQGSSSTVKKEVPKNESEFSISLSSDYGTVIKFIEKLESFPRINSVDSITITGYDRTSGNLNLRITGRIFYGK